MVDDRMGSCQSAANLACFSLRKYCGGAVSTPADFARSKTHFKCVVIVLAEVLREYRGKLRSQVENAEYHQTVSTWLRSFPRYKWKSTGDRSPVQRIFHSWLQMSTLAHVCRARRSNGLRMPQRSDRIRRRLRFAEKCLWCQMFIGQS